jgi:predicted kinase
MAFYVIIRGPLGSGKSTLSKSLSETLNAELFPVDRILEEYHLENELEEGYISQKSFKKANGIIASRAQKLLEAGKPVVFDGNFYWKSQIQDLVSRLAFPHRVFTLKAPLEVCIERDRNRKKSHGEDAARAVFSKSAGFEYGIPVDVNRPPKECVDEILSHLPKRQP